MNSVILILLVAVAVQAKHSADLNFHEGGKAYKERITFDDESNTTEFHVPKHAAVPFDVDYLIDHNTHYEFRKIEGEKRCYARKMSKDEEFTNKDMETVTQVSGGNFPTNRYYVENRILVPSHELDRTRFSNKVGQFCGDYPIILEKEMSSLAEVEKHMERTQASRAKRQIYKDWASCNDSTMLFCQKATAKCRFITRSCIYWLKCKRITVNNQLALNCYKPGEPNHKYNSNVCCDFTCI